MFSGKESAEAGIVVGRNLPVNVTAVSAKCEGR